MQKLKNQTHIVSCLEILFQPAPRPWHFSGLFRDLESLAPPRTHPPPPTPPPPPPPTPSLLLSHRDPLPTGNFSGGNWGMLARVTLWCVPNAPLLTAPKVSVTWVGEGLSFVFLQVRTMPTNILWAQIRHVKAIRAPATERLPCEDGGVQNGSGHKGIHPQQDSCHPPCQAHSGWSKTESVLPRPLPHGYIVRRIPQPSSLSLSLLSLLVWIDLQKPGYCLWAIPRVPSTFQGITKWWVTWLLPGISVFLCPCHLVASCLVLRGLLWLLDVTVGPLGHSVPSVTRRDHWGKRDVFLSASDSQYSHSMVDRLWVGSVTSQEALSYSTLGYILRNWILLTLQKAWLQNKQRTPKNGLWMAH